MLPQWDCGDLVPKIAGRGEKTTRVKYKPVLEEQNFPFPLQELLGTRCDFKIFWMRFNYSGELLGAFVRDFTELREHPVPLQSPVIPELLGQREAQRALRALQLPK